MTRIEWFLMAVITALVLVNAIPPAKAWLINLMTGGAA